MDITTVGGVSRGLIVVHGPESIDSCSLQREEYFSHVSQRRLPWLLSNHFPFLGANNSLGPHPPVKSQ
jgi:hypothetical protein